MNRITKRTFVVVILAFLLLAGIGFFTVEYALKSREWVLTSGSPHVYNGENIGTGEVVDREGTFLLSMDGDRTYSEDIALRQATVHWLGDRKGSISAPALTHFASYMVSYNGWDGVYRYADEKSVAHLTLSGTAQKAALEALGDMKGTVGVYNYKTGAILCAVTSPNYDPDNIPDVDGDTTGKYEGIYVNRFTRSSYIPGSIFKSVTLAAVIESHPEILEQKFTCTGRQTYGTEKVTCEAAHGTQTVKQAFCNSCNCAFAQIMDLLGGDTLKDYVNQFKVVEGIEFDGITTAPGNFDIENAAPVSIAWSGIGQYLDQINPCVFMTYMGALANGGQSARPYLVEKITCGEETSYTAKTQMGSSIMAAETAETVKEYLRNNVEQKYGAENFGGLTVCAKTGTAQQGGEKASNAMLAGFSVDEEYPFAFFACVEGYGYGRSCIPLVAKVLTACRESVDQG